MTETMTETMTEPAAVSPTQHPLRRQSLLPETVIGTHGYCTSEKPPPVPRVSVEHVMGWSRVTMVLDKAVLTCAASAQP